MKRHALSIALLMVTGMLAACGGAPDPAKDVADFTEEVRQKLPAGWQVARAKDLSFPLLPPTAPDSLVVYKTEPVPLEAARSATVIDATTADPDSAAPADIDTAPPVASRPGEVGPTDAAKGHATTQAVRSGHIYYSLVLHPFRDPEKYLEEYKKNEALRKEHRRVLAKIANVPRDEKGNPVPRGVPETVEVNAVMEEYKHLPPFQEHMPTHYYGSVAFKLHDYRVQLVPLDRELQQEQNRVYALLIEKLKRYPLK